MKKLVLSQIWTGLLCSLLPVVALAQIGPPPATQAEVDAGLNAYKYVTPATLAGSTLIGGGGGGAVSNVLRITFTKPMRYTNATPYVADITIAYNVSPAAGINSGFVTSLDTNLDFTADFVLTNSISPTLTTSIAMNSVARFLVPSGSAWALTNVPSSGTVTFETAGGSIFYYSTNSSGGGGVSETEVAAIMATNNAATATKATNSITATNAPDGSALSASLPIIKSTFEPMRLMQHADFASDVGEEYGFKITTTYADRGLFKLLSIGNTFTNQYSGAYARKFLNYYGYGDVPVGVTSTQRYAAYVNWSNGVSVLNNLTNWTFPDRSVYNSNYPNAVNLDRQILALQPDASVVVLEEGDLSILKALWDSPADSYSSLNGSNLAELKIKGLLISAGNTNSADFNLGSDMYAATVISNITVPTIFVLGSTPASVFGHNATNPAVHPVDSPLYQGATNYHITFGYSVVTNWDLWTKTYLANAAAAGNFLAGTNSPDGTAHFTLVGPTRAHLIPGGSGTLVFADSGTMPNNHYYLVNNGFTALSTNIANEVLDGPPRLGGGNIYNSLRRSGDAMTGPLRLNSTGTNMVAFNTNVIVADGSNERVSLGRSRWAPVGGTAPIDVPTNRVEAVGTAASTTAAGMEPIFGGVRPTLASTRFPQAFSFALGAWRNVPAGLDSDTYLTINIKSDDTANTLGAQATWVATFGFKETNVVALVPMLAASYGDSANGLNRIDMNNTYIDMRVNGTVTARFFSDDIYMPSGGTIYIADGVIGGGTVRLGIGIRQTTFDGVEFNNGTAGSLTNVYGGNINAAAYFSGTNSINTGAYAAGLSYFTNLGGNIVLSPFASIPANSWVITIAAKNTSGADRTVTFPNGTVNNINGVGPAVAYVTNNTTLVMQVTGFGSSFTNVLTPH